MLRFAVLVLVLAVVAPALPGQDIPLTRIVVPGEGWREVARGWPDVTFLEGQPAGSVVLYQGKATGRINDGKAEKFTFPNPGPSPRNQHSIREYRIVDGSVVRGTLPGKALKLKGLVAPNCLAVWPDEGHLVIGEADGAYLWAVRIEKDGSLGPGDRYYSLRTEPGKKLPITAMTTDAGYLLYAATPLGIQVFDPTGRLSGVIAAPAKESMTALAIGGEKADTLFVSAGERIYARKIQGKASYTLTKEK
jgi:sugar lactone lactonase YvrE